MIWFFVYVLGLNKLGCASSLLEQVRPCVRLAQVLDKLGCASSLLEQEFGPAFGLHKFLRLQIY